jgi:hypothetical protein
MIVADALPERNARITRHEVQNAVAEKLSEHADATTLERLTDAVLAHDELVFVHAPEHAEAGWEQEWTTRRLLALEAELTQLYQPVPDPSRALDPTVVATTLRRLDRPLGPDQADTVSLVCTQGRSVEVVIGRAGTGKTYTMRTVREVYEAAGQHPVGVCPTARAARELADGAASNRSSSRASSAIITSFQRSQPEEDSERPSTRSATNVGNSRSTDANTTNGSTPLSTTSPTATSPPSGTCTTNTSESSSPTPLAKSATARSTTGGTPTTGANAHLIAGTRSEASS